MAPQSPTLTIVQGITSSIMVPLVLDDPAGWRFAAQIRQTAASPDVLAQWTEHEVEASPHMLRLPLRPEVTSQWQWSYGVLGIEAMSPDGQVIRVLQTAVSLDREIVRPMFPEVTNA